MNLLHFEAKSKAKISVYQYFASELLSNQERLVITRAFKLLDEEGDGELKLAEIKVGIKNYLKDYDTIQFTDDRIMRVIKMINIPNDGT